jgi:hypothetical protein
MSLIVAVLVAAVPKASRAAQRPPVCVVDIREAPRAEHLLCASIQGLVNRQAEGPLVFLITRDTDEEWLSYSLRMTSAQAAWMTPGELLETFRPDLHGQVLYDPLKPYTLDLATTVAGLRDVVITDRDLGLPTVLDFRGRWRSTSAAYQWAIASLLPECSQSKAALLPAEAAGLRDFAIQQRMFVLSPPAAPEDDSFQRLLFQLPPGTAVYGEASPTIASELSRGSHFLVPASETANLSFFSKIEPEQTHHQYVGYLEARAPRYLTLIVDCSDLGFAVDEMPRLWQHPVRGSLSLGWALPAALAEAAPPIARRYYSDAYWSGSDQFVLGRSGAGQIDLWRAPSPFGFFDATARARAKLDVSAALCTARNPITEADDLLLRFARAAGLEGLFVVVPEDFPPMFQEGVVTICAPRFQSAEAAVTYLNRIPLERRFAALVLDPEHLTPEDAAHIAAHVATRYVAVPPAELVEIMRTIGLPQQPGDPEVRVVSADYGDPMSPSAPIPVIARIAPSENVSWAGVVYKPAEHALSFVESMSPTRNGTFEALLPPLPQGGDLILRVRAQDRAGRETWSPAWTLTIAHADADSDGLSDAEEAYLLTDPEAPDTDGDGLRDAADSAPLRFDAFAIWYAGPIEPPSDLPYLVEAGQSRADLEGRHLPPGQGCTYSLPASLLPEGAPAVIEVNATGALEIAAGADLAAPSQRFDGHLDGYWCSAPFTRESGQGDMLLQLRCPDGASDTAVIGAISLVSPPEAPSITQLSTHPAPPGPEQPIRVSAKVFSPEGVGEVSLTYRINNGGTITVPLTAIGDSQRYEARIPALANRDLVEFWVSASTADGKKSVTAPEQLTIGSWPREVVSLLGRRDFLGEWLADPGWGDAARRAPQPDLQDVAHVNVRGGSYTVWILAGPRGQGMDIYIRDEKAGSVDPGRPDGWQRVGRVSLNTGRHEVRVTSREEPDAPPGASPRYAAVVLAASSGFVPPVNRVLDVYDAISLLFPPADHTLSGRVELRATGAGNITAVDFSIDGQVLRRVAGPPFRLSVNAGRLAPGPHVLRVEALDRAGPTGLAVEVPITVAE